MEKGALFVAGEVSTARKRCDASSVGRRFEIPAGVLVADVHGSVCPHGVGERRIRGGLLVHWERGRCEKHSASQQHRHAQRQCFTNRRIGCLAVLVNSFFLVLELQTTAWSALGHWNRDAENYAEDALPLSLPLAEEPPEETPKVSRRLRPGFIVLSTWPVACIEIAIDGERPRSYALAFLTCAA